MGLWAEYWFYRQDVPKTASMSGQQSQPDLWPYTNVSLLIWVGFFVLLLALLVIAG